MSSRFFAGAAALAIILAAGHALAAARNQRVEPVAKSQKAATAPRPAALGATVESPLVQPETRSARVIAEFDNKTTIWRPGAAVTSGIVIKEEPVEVRVPRVALQTIGGERVVFVRTPTGFQRRAVTIGGSDEQAVEIVSGLSAGEQIAVKNTFLLKADLGKGEAGDTD